MFTLLSKFLILKMSHIKVFHYARPSGDSEKRLLRREVKLEYPMKVVLAAVVLQQPRLISCSFREGLGRIGT